MTKKKFLIKFNALLKKYCTDNADYENVNLVSVHPDSRDKHKFDVRVFITTYKFGKQ